MISNVDPISAKFLNDVARIGQKLARANDQVTSGLRVAVASDAPDQISTLLQLRAILSHNTQIQSNLTLAQSDASAADDALGSAIQLMDSAVSLAAQGATATTDAAGRLNIAQQIATLQQEMVANSQANVQGRFLFSGDHDGTAQYTWDPVTASVLSSGTAASTRLIENPSGGTFAASLTAQQIFDNQDASTNQPAGDNVFNALSTLRAALQNNDTAGITSAMSLLKMATDHLNTAQAFYGNVEASIQNANQYASQTAVQLQTQIGQIQDADVPAAAMELTAGNTQLQAAFQMKAQMPHSSLFQYLG